MKYRKTKLLKAEFERMRAQRDEALAAAAAARSDYERALGVIEGLRWRLFSALKASDNNAEIFGLPRYTMASVEDVAGEAGENA